MEICSYKAKTSSMPQSGGFLSRKKRFFQNSVIEKRNNAISPRPVRLSAAGRLRISRRGNTLPHFILRLHRGLAIGGWRLRTGSRRAGRAVTGEHHERG